MGGVGFEFDPSALVRGLQRLPHALDVELEHCLRKAGRVIATQARASHDYTDRTGRLTRSILPMATTGRFTEDTLDGGAGAYMPYAAYVEEGTARMHIHGGYRFLRLAAFQRYRDVEQLFNDHVETAVRRAGL
ncbi:MAG: HK97 gp10 family phage protein [Deltaproteobacteria bacterium]|nr:HK97 gp10 family phage protein [Myxococcales bacterium]MDP3219740.1 HK97 gp10 family phage protein [Deltaproteobacteria bacterium]